MALALRKEKHSTYADYLQWPDDARYELIDGEAFLMAPAPLIEHQEIAGEVYRQLANQLDSQPCRTYERAGVREYWLAHPGDRTLTAYLLEDG